MSTDDPPDLTPREPPEPPIEEFNAFSISASTSSRELNSPLSAAVNAASPPAAICAAVPICKNWSTALDRSSCAAAFADCTIANAASSIPSRLSRDASLTRSKCSLLDARAEDNPGITPSIF